MQPFRAATRKSLLTVHVLASVGWFGAVAAFLAIAIVGVSAPDSVAVAGIYAALDVLIWAVIVPLSLLALASGILQAVGTPWGLLRYYWVVAKLLLTLVATVVLLIHTGAVDAAAAAAMHPSMDIDAMGVQLVVDSAAALVVLVLATVLSIVKPRGTTPWATRPVDRSADSDVRD